MADQSSSDSEHQEQKDAAVSRRAKILATLLPIIAALPVVVAFVAKKMHMEMERELSRQAVAEAVDYPDEATMTQPVFTQPKENKPKLYPIETLKKSLSAQAQPTPVPSSSQPKLTPVSGAEAELPAILDPVQAVIDPLQSTPPTSAPKLTPVPKDELPTSVSSRTKPKGTSPILSAPRTPVSRDTQSKSSSSATAVAPRKPILHIVRRGETLTEIASKFDLSARDLAMANGFPVDAQILGGQILRIPYPDEVARYGPAPARDLIPTSAIPPGGSSSSTRNLPKLHPILPTSGANGTSIDSYSIRYIVQPSDRLESIAAAHSTNVATISARNGGITYVRTGQEIIVPVGHILVPSQN